MSETSQASIQAFDEEESFLRHAADASFSRYLRSHDQTDFNNAIACSYTRINSMRDDSPSKGLALCEHGLMLSSRFRISGEDQDQDDCISALQKGISLQPDESPLKAPMLCYLGEFLVERCQRRDCREDLEAGLSAFRKADDLIPEEHEMRARIIVGNGSILFARYKLSGDLEDLRNAMSKTQEGLDLERDISNKARWKVNFGNILAERFDVTSAVADIDRAIMFLQAAVDEIPDSTNNDVKIQAIISLSSALRQRSLRLNDPRDTQGAIDALEHALNHIPTRCLHDFHKLCLMDSLGATYSIRFRQLGERVDIERAISVLQEACRLAVGSRIKRAKTSFHLGLAYKGLYDCLKGEEDFNNAICAFREAVDHTNSGDTDEGSRLRTLGVALLERSLVQNDHSDYDEAVSFIQKSIRLIPEGHPNQADNLGLLGSAFLQRFTFLDPRDPSDLHTALHYFRQASSKTSGLPTRQLAAVKLWIRASSHTTDISLKLEAYEKYFEILPQVVWLGQEVGLRYEELPGIGRSVGDAAAWAISTGDLLRAIEWLEEGRGVIWKQILQLRTPLTHLREEYPDLAQKLESVAGSLRNVGTHSDTSPFSRSTAAEMQARRRREDAVEYERLIKEIRLKSGFEDFLGRKGFSVLKQAPCDGLVTIVNAAVLGCDALAVSPSGEVCHIELPDFSYEQACVMYLDLLSLRREWEARMGLGTSMVRFHTSDSDSDEIPVYETRAVHQVKLDSTADIQSILAELWLNVVKPILSAMNMLKPQSSDSCLPHITWCATGPLAFLPLHAAGLYNSHEPEDVTQYAVSSYTPSLVSLLETRNELPAKSAREPSVLVISQPNTPGQAALHSAVDEAKVVKKYMQNHLHLTDDEATAEVVLEKMEDHEWLHLACHGLQNPAKPLESAFALHKSELTLESLMGKTHRNAELAVLFACQTATGDGNLPEEAVHLAAGMLSVGYPSVIATMWSIRDADAPLITEKLYSQLSKQVSDAGEKRLSSAYALHEAVKSLRNEVGEGNFDRWVPYIHLGK